jgi:hypothetical protein
LNFPSGDAIQDIMEKMPNKKLLVLCGHSHTYAKYQPLPNILAITGKGEYGKCYISEVFDLNFPDLKCDIVTKAGCTYDFRNERAKDSSQTVDSDP